MPSIAMSPPIYSEWLLIRSPSNGLATIGLINETGSLQFANNRFVDQPFEIDIADLGIAQFHEALNVLQSVDGDMGTPVGAPHIIIVAVIGRRRVSNAQPARQDFVYRSFVRGVMHVAMGFD